MLSEIYYLTISKLMSYTTFRQIYLLTVGGFVDCRRQPELETNRILNFVSCLLNKAFSLQTM